VHQCKTLHRNGAHEFFVIRCAASGTTPGASDGHGGFDHGMGTQTLFFKGSKAVRGHEDEMQNRS
jgi:hypothetical protein